MCLEILDDLTSFPGWIARAGSEPSFSKRIGNGGGIEGLGYPVALSLGSTGELAPPRERAYERDLLSAVR